MFAAAAQISKFTYLKIPNFKMKFDIKDISVTKVLFSHHYFFRKAITGPDKLVLHLTKSIKNVIVFLYPIVGLTVTLKFRTAIKALFFCFCSKTYIKQMILIMLRAMWHHAMCNLMKSGEMQ